MTHSEYMITDRKEIKENTIYLAVFCRKEVEIGKTHSITVDMDENPTTLKITPSVKADCECYSACTQIHMVVQKYAKGYYVKQIFSDRLFQAVYNAENSILITILRLDSIIDDTPILNQLDLYSSSKSKSKGRRCNPGVYGKSDLVKKFSLIESTLTQHTATVVKNWLNHPSHSVKDGRKAERFLNCTPSYAYRPTEISAEKLKEEFDGHIYGHERAKQVLIRKLIRKTKTKGPRGNCFLLVGPSGSGKTALAKAYAEASGIPYAKIELSAVSSALDLKGCLSTYDGADFSVFVRAFGVYNTTEMVFLMENLDMLSTESDKYGKPIDVVANIVSQSSFTDAYMDGIGIDISNTDFIITARTIENIPQSILDNVTVIHLPEYSFDERVDIAREKILPELYLNGDYDFEYPDIPDLLLMYIARQYCCDDGVKDLERHLRTLFDQYPENGKITMKVIDHVLAPMVDEKNPGVILNRSYDNYSSEQIREIRRTIAKTQSSLVKREEKDLEKMRLNYLLKAAKKPCKKINMKHFKKEINQSHFGMEKVKEKIIDAFASQETFGTLRSILLVGPAGTGKTTISRTIAQASGKDFKKISLNGLNHSSLLRGSTKSHKNADAGEIVKAYCDASSGLTLLMDEVDKIDPSMANCVLDLIDEYEFLDDFVSVTFDLSDVLFIFTANDASRISPYLYDRFDTVIYLDGYDRSQRMQIVRDYVIPEINREYNLNVTADNTAIEALVNEYSVTNGVRDIKNKIYEIVRHLCSHNKGKNIHITAKNITAYFDKPPMLGNIPQTESDSGVALGLAVSSRGGMAFAVETELIPKANYLKITGLPEADVRESAELCVTYIRKHFHRLLNEGIHIHYSEGAVKKSGPSAGVTTFISLLSATFDVPVSHEFAYTGELDLKGHIFAIGCEIEKLEAAARQGCKTVFIPAENYKRMINKGIDMQSFGVEIVPVSHISDVIARVLPEALSNNRKKSA